ncbi:hypothetical protein DFP72DRAFT_226016 [Ephemerocybe angulata]|uniref:Uncharacterized protein n=1 Tax=Ephemerocybe angulata TaxID=980116 RepID=A0A8H6LUS6_9AGAR|nr:hypothetical protein DFP72DRAFT_226016 [Tulosesus angulatus]
MGDAGFSFADLPEDLARLVIEAALEGGDATAWACAKLCKSVQAWVEPILYRNIFADDFTTITLLHRTILSHPSKELDFFLTNVKSLTLGLGRGSPFEAIVDILHACAPVERLDIDPSFDPLTPPSMPWQSRSLRLATQSAWNRLRPKELGISRDFFVGFPEKYHFRVAGPNANPIFTNVTHLTFGFSAYDRPALWCWDTLSQLSELTHLCFHSELICIGVKWLPLIACHFPRTLRVCAFHLAISTFEARVSRYQFAKVFKDIGEIEERIVVALDRPTLAAYMLTLDSAIPQGKLIWKYQNEEEMRKGSDDTFWRRAEGMVATMRKGKHGLPGQIGGGTL